MKKKSLIEQVGEYNKLYEKARMKLDATIHCNKPDGNRIDTRSFESEDTQRSINPESSDI